MVISCALQKYSLTCWSKAKQLASARNTLRQTIATHHYDNMTSKFAYFELCSACEPLFAWQDNEAAKLTAVPCSSFRVKSSAATDVYVTAQPCAGMIDSDAVKLTAVQCCSSTAKSSVADSMHVTAQPRRVVFGRTVLLSSLQLCSEACSL